MIYGAVLAVNYPGCAHLEPTPDRWGRSGVRALRLRRAPGADQFFRDPDIWDGDLNGTSFAIQEKIPDILENILQKLTYSQ